MKKINLKWFHFLLIAVFIIFLVEIFLRSYYGFCDTVLIREDKEYEYIAEPNQDRFRFRNHVTYNSFSMRSPQVDSSATIILGFGDSILNGGTQTDQDSLATNILTKVLTQQFQTKIQFLNISAGSWGPDNCFAYLKKHGNFGAKKIVLFVSSHDAYDNMSFNKVVDVHESYPSKQYFSAIYEAIDRYIIPRIVKPKKNISDAEKLAINKRQKDSHFNTGFASFLNYCKTNKIPFSIYLHADKQELKAGDYNDQGKDIIKFATDHNVPIVLDLKNGLSASDFRDNIHINSQGQRRMANLIQHYVKLNFN